MTFYPDNDNHQITRVQPTMIVVEEDRGIESYDYPLLQYRGGSRWALVIALVIGGVIGLLWNLEQEPIKEFVSAQQVLQATDIPQPSQISELQETLLYEGVHTINHPLVTTTITLQQDNDDFLWVFPVDETSVNYVVSANIGIGYDLSQATAIDVDGIIHIFLPSPQVFSVDVRSDLSYFDVDMPKHGTISPETMTTILNIAEDALIDQAYVNGIVAEINNNGPQWVKIHLFKNIPNLVWHTQYIGGK